MWDEKRRLIIKASIFDSNENKHDKQNNASTYSIYNDTQIYMTFLINTCKKACLEFCMAASANDQIKDSKSQ